MTHSLPVSSRRPLRLAPLPHPERPAQGSEEPRESLADGDDDEGAWIHEWSVPEPSRRLALDA